MSQAGRYIAGTGAAPIETVTGNVGGAVSPDGAGNINIVGGTNITTTGNPGTNTLTIDLDGNVADTFNGDVGSAFPFLGIIGFAGGNNIATSAAGSQVTFNVDGTTDHSLLLGNATGSINSLGVATNGQLPIGSTGSDPVLATLTAGTNISITNGPGSITIDCTASGGVTSITGDTGAAQTGAITLTGGTTGASYGGAAGTITMTFAGITANAGVVNLGTDATDNAINIGTAANTGRTVTIGNTTGTSDLDLRCGTGDFTLASATGTIISAADTGEINYPLQPAFQAYVSSTISNVTGDNTVYTIIYDTEAFDQGSDFNTGTGVFTAPVTGKYLFCGVVSISGVSDASQTIWIANLVSSGSTYQFCLEEAIDVQAGSQISRSFSVLVNMTAADTASVNINVIGTSKTVNVVGGIGRNSFCGYLAC